MKFLVKLGLPASALVDALTGFTDRGDALLRRSVKLVVLTVTIARGEKIAQLICPPCHADNANRLTGRRMADVSKLFGKIYSTNLTQDSTAGVGHWTDNELIRFRRTGARRDGSLAPAMLRYPLMADEDLQAVVAYLHSDAYPVRATATEAPRTRYSLPVKLLAKSLFKPLPDTTDEVALSRYLADGVIDCYGCHSADFKKLDPLHPERSKGYYAGGNRLLGDGGKPVFSTNLTFDEATGVGKIPVHPGGETRRPVRQHPARRTNAAPPGADRPRGRGDIRQAENHSPASQRGVRYTDSNFLILNVQL